MAQFDLFGTREPTVGEKIKSFFKNDKEPLEKKAIMAHYRIKTAIGRVRSYIDRLSQKDRELFERVVEALMKRDEARAKMYAKEVSEIRKISKQLLMVEYVLEHAAIKLETFMIFGGAITELKPVLAVMKQAVGVLRSVAPDIWIDLQYAMRELEASLGAGIADMSTQFDVGLDNEARKIFEEAKVVAEQKMKEKYAELPKLLNVGVEEEEKAGEVSP